jgi:hypothetical protein
MDDRLHKALAAIDPATAAHCAARWHRMDAAERGRCSTWSGSTATPCGGCGWRCGRIG